MLESLTLFDAAVFTIILVSAIMALSRGFMRELATLGAFIAALAAAWYARIYFRETLTSMMPETAPGWSSDAILVVGAFLIVYIIVAWFGQRLSKNIQGMDGIGWLDRIAGFIFGLARGGVAMVFFVVLLNVVLDPQHIPGFIQDARTYPALSKAADYINSTAPDLANEVSLHLPLEPETVQDIE